MTLAAPGITHVVLERADKISTLQIHMTTPESDSFLRSFARGLSVIEAMGRGSGSHTVASVSASTQLPRTVVRRILMTLSELGYTTSDGKEFRLTPKILNLGMTYLTSLPFWGLAQRVLEDLCAEVRESCALSVFDGTDMIYVLRIPSRKIMSLRLGMGSHLPAYATSPGRVLLAFQQESTLQRYLQDVPLKPYTAKTVSTEAGLRQSLSEIREAGYAWVDAEFDPEICGLSVPVRDENRNVVAALSVNLLSGETTPAAAIRKLLMPLRKSAEQLRAMAPQFLASVGHTFPRG